MSYLSRDLGGGGGGSHSGSGREDSGRRGGKERYWRRHGLPHPQVLPPQVKQVHGGHSILS